MSEIHRSGISITNHTKKPIDITLDYKDGTDKDHVIQPKDSFMIFLDRVVSIRWIDK